MNKLNTQERARIISCLAEGCSLLSTVRLTCHSRKGVASVLVGAGTACAKYHDKIMRNLTCKLIQVDEVWQWVYCKQANIPKELKGIYGVGDTWTWIALDADTKLIPSWHVGKRGLDDATTFLNDLKERLASRVQLTSDGHRAYLQAVEETFGTEIDYAMLIKLYGKEIPKGETRYSPPKCIGTRRRKIQGNPDRNLISTSYIERQNLTLRMQCRRLTRLTNAFSKKIENHCHALAIQFMYYNFCRIHKTLRVTPAMEAGISNHVWDATEIAKLW